MKRHRAKIIGALVGFFFFGGPFSALIGFWIGYCIDKKHGRRRLATRYAGRSEAVIAAVTALGAKIAKADGHVSQGEIRAFREAFNISEADGPRIAELWQEAAKTPAGYEPYARHLQQIFADDPRMLRRILSGLRRVMLADVQVRADKQWALEDIARIFGVEPNWSEDARHSGIDLDLRDVEVESMKRAFRGLFSNETADPELQIFGNGSSRQDKAIDTIVGWLTNPLVRDALGAAGFLSVYITCMVTGVFDDFFRFSDIILSMAAGGLFGAVLRAVLPTRSTLSRKVDEAAKDAQVSSGEITDTIRDTQTKVADIRQNARRLPGPNRQSIERICTIATDIADNLIREPGDVARSRPFLMHYLGATHDVVRRFAELRGRPSGSKPLDPVFDKLPPLLNDLETLFRTHYERGLADEALELDVSIESLQRMVRSEQA